jgi:hypothetical protein
VNGKRITDDKGLLALRTDPTLSIVAAAQYDAEVFSQLTKRGLIPASLTQDQMAQYLYKGHHEGYEGARQMLSGTLPNDASTKRKFDQNVPEKKQQDYLNKYKEVTPNIVKVLGVPVTIGTKTTYNYAKSYTSWLDDYTKRNIVPSRYR